MSSLGRILLVVLAPLALGLGAGGALTALRIVRVQVPVSQPYPFNHAAHSAAACTTCHRGVRSGAHAGIPSLEICSSCHATPPGEPDAGALAAWEAATEGNPPPWKRLYAVPEHVYFSHRRHTELAGLDCSECHGAMAQATEPPSLPDSPMRMHTCITCHEQHGVAVDCTECHK